MLQDGDTPAGRDAPEPHLLTLGPGIRQELAVRAELGKVRSVSTEGEVGTILLVKIIGSLEDGDTLRTDGQELAVRAEGGPAHFAGAGFHPTLFGVEGPFGGVHHAPDRDTVRG